MPKLSTRQVENLGGSLDYPRHTHDYCDMNDEVGEGPPTLSVQVGDEIRVWMTRRRLTGERLAQRLKVSPAWVSYRINGKQEIGLDDLQQIAAALEVEVIDLLPVEVAEPAAKVAPLAARVITRRRRESPTGSYGATTERARCVPDRTTTPRVVRSTTPDVTHRTGRATRPSS
jgi:transcriptional regulator with XRE-family HTH domain